MVRCTASIRLVVAAAAAFLSLPALASDGDASSTVAELKQLLAQYDSAGGGDTIPIEQALIRLRDLKAGAELVPFLAHRRFGSVAAWALSEVGDAAQAGAMLDALQGRDAAGKAELALYAGAFRTEGMRAALKAFEGAAETSPAHRALAGAARLRAGDPALEKDLLERLKGKDARAIADALLTIGDSRRADLLGRVVAFARDARPVGAGLTSAFGVETVTHLPDGGVSSTTTHPELKTLADAAAEAASRLVAPTTPDMIAWWYETEAGPRFPISPEGEALLAAYGAAAAKAAAAKALTPGEAVAAVLRHVREAPGGEHVKARIASVAFAGTWQIGYRLQGGGAGEGEAARTASVDAAGKVTAR